MELFKNAKIVRLRSHHDKYLLAGEDKEHVIQDRDGSTENARWTVEKTEDEGALRLKSCYGRYLTASNEPCLLGVTGRKVLQTVPPPLDDASVEWEPARDGFQVRLKSRYGQFLRANGGVPPWRNSITHDVPHHAATQDWVLWEVDILEHHLSLALAHSPPHLEHPSSAFGADMSPHWGDGRLIYYAIAEDDGSTDSSSTAELSFMFRGTTVGQLTEKLKEVTGIVDDHFFVCSRSPFNGTLCPLHLQLPPNSATMHIVVVPSSSTVAKSLV